jgi:hypothetical protein
LRPATRIVFHAAAVVGVAHHRRAVDEELVVVLVVGVGELVEIRQHRRRNERPGLLAPQRSAGAGKNACSMPSFAGT